MRNLSFVYSPCEISSSSPDLSSSPPLFLFFLFHVGICHFGRLFCHLCLFLYVFFHLSPCLSGILHPSFHYLCPYSSHNFSPPILNALSYHYRMISYCHFSPFVCHRHTFPCPSICPFSVLYHSFVHLHDDNYVPACHLSSCPLFLSLSCIHHLDSPPVPWIFPANSSPM